MTSSARDRAIEVIAEKIYDIHGPHSTDQDSAEMDAQDIVGALLAHPEVLRALSDQTTPGGGPMPPRVQVSWVDHDEDDGDLHETGWIMAVEGEVAVVDCDCGPRTVRRPLSALTLGPSRRTEDTLP